MCKNNTKIRIELVKDAMECLNKVLSGFKITRIINRKSVDIELTYQELSNAFYYQEHKNHISDIKNSLAEMEYDKELKNHTAEEIYTNDILMAKIISDYEENINDREMKWSDAVLEAIRKNIENTENNEVSK